MATDAGVRAQHLRHGITLEYLTVGWNILESVAALATGAIAGSVALVGFGVDSFIETSSGAILLWRLKAEHSGANAKQVERKALKLVGCSFVLLALYIAVDSTRTLLLKARPERSFVGIAIALLSLLVMPWLAHHKRRAAAHLDSAALKADSLQTSLCAYLSAMLLVGLLLNALFGWWWADPIAALCMVPIIASEGAEALKGERCSDCH